jgi:outer membrane lipoprotein-sorting protein
VTAAGLGSLVLLLLTRAPGAPCTSTASCLAEVERAQRDTRALTADFTQVKHLSLLGEPLVSRGRLSFRRPDRMRLEIAEPVQATVVVNGRDVRLPGLSEQDAQALATAPVGAIFSQLGALFVGDTASLHEGFEVVAAPAGEGVTVTLVPRLESWRRIFQRLELRFEGAEMLVREIRIEDALGDRLEITLEHVQRNVDLPEALFEPPPGGNHPGGR